MNKNREQKKPGTHKNSSLSSGLYFHMVGLVKKKKQDVLKLRNRLQEAGKTTTAIKEAMKNEITYQKTVLNKKHLTLKGTLFDLIRTLREHLPEHQPEADQGSDSGVPVTLSPTSPPTGS